MSSGRRGRRGQSRQGRRGPWLQEPGLGEAVAAGVLGGGFPREMVLKLLMDACVLTPGLRVRMARNVADLDRTWVGVAQDKVGRYRVSTAFIGQLGASYCWRDRKQVPRCFETMIFEARGRGERALDYQERCRTWRQALAQHAAAVAQARALAAAKPKRRRADVGKAPQG